jgi:hypothetical protein
MTGSLPRASPELHPRPIAVIALDGFLVPDRLSADAVVGCFREREGLTIYADLAAAEAAGLPIAMRAAWITLMVETALDLVGFTAAFSRALAEAGVACNVIAGARHDHILVPLDQADAAMQALNGVWGD